MLVFHSPYDFSEVLPSTPNRGLFPLPNRGLVGQGATTFRVRFRLPTRRGRGGRRPRARARLCRRIIIKSPHLGPWDGRPWEEITEARNGRLRRELELLRKPPPLGGEMRGV